MIDRFVHRFREIRVQRILCTFLTLSVSAPAVLFAQDWPQWRGPDRNNISKATGLMETWPVGGPPLAWEAPGLGDGVVPVSVDGGRVFCTGYRGDDEFCTAISEADGSILWQVRLGPAVKESPIMRWLNQRTPTVDEDRVYVVTVLGDYICLETATGQELWRRNATEDFGSKTPIFGFCDYPMIDGDRLILSPGGIDSTIAAVDKRTGEIVWRCRSGEINGAAHAALATAEIGGVRQYINAFANGLIGVRASDGELLWAFPLSMRIAVTHSPIVQDDTVFYASGYGSGHVLIQISRQTEIWNVTELYAAKFDYPPWLGSLTLWDDHVLCNPTDGLACIERSTGKVAWRQACGRNTYTVADGKLYVWTKTGVMSLVAADVNQYRLISEFRPFDPLDSQHGISFPVVANARLYVRDLDRIRCFDLRQPPPPERQIPDAVFVPTPADIVPHMLQLAAIQKSDLVFDLGCGDGRLVVAAAKMFGCRAVGIEIDPELVALARKLAIAVDVDEVVEIEQKNIFDSDFSQADVLLLYILPEMLQRLIPQFKALQPGSRIVSHAFAIPGMKPSKVVEIESSEDGEIHQLFLYTVPLDANDLP